MFACDEHGIIIEMDDISVTIPPGAIPSKTTAHIELGVALCGPFVFPDKYQPVSPIIWLCFQEDIEIRLPIMINLPHMVTDIDKVDLKFAKASHLEYSYNATKEKEVYHFKHLQDERSFFTNLSDESGYGILHVKHCCLYCIEAKTSRDLALKLGYCLHTLIKCRDPSHYQIVLVCTFFLRSCFRVSLKTSLTISC